MTQAHASATFAMTAFDGFLPFAEQIELGLREPDLPFDPFANLPPAIALSLAAVVERDAPRSRLRPRTAKEERVFPLRIGLVAANALQAWDEGGFCHYSRSTSAYRGQSRYHPSWLSSKRFVGAVDRMVEAGLIHSVCARPGTHGGGRSMMVATDRLVAAVSGLNNGVLPSFLDGGQRPWIFLKDEQKNLVEFDETPETVAMANELKSYDEFLSRKDIGIWENGINREKKHFRNLYRVFNESSWQCGGRVFGGWWQALSGPSRAAITINGNPTNELDYSAFSLRAMYHLNGLECYGDPYSIHELDDIASGMGIDPEAVRKSVKLLSMFLVNGSTAQGVGGLDLATKPYIPNGEVLKLLKRRHSSISNFFHSGYGLKIMKMESDLCMNILNRGREEGICVLPIHDSYIVSYENVDWLRYVMSNSYYKMFNYYPVIK